MVRVSFVGAGGWQREQLHPLPARAHAAATASWPGGGPHTAHSAPAGVERPRRPPDLEHVCHGPVSKMRSGGTDVIRVTVHVGQGAVGGSAVKGSIPRPNTCSDGSTTRGRVGATRPHACTRTPR